jgi:hypothetical protein
MERYLIKRQANELKAIPDKGEFFRVYRDKYWLADDENNIYFYNSLLSPQCNSNKLICENRIKKEHKIFTKILFITKIFVPFDPHEFCI